MVILQVLKVSFISLIVMLFVSNCNENTTVRYSGTTSACNHFQTFSKQMASNWILNIDSVSYCKAERLWWRYDPLKNYISLFHTRISLNCAAQPSITAEIDGNTVTINEIDIRKDKSGQATCSCCFDTYLEIQKALQGIVLLNISTKTFSIDTRLGEGVFVIDSSMDSVCLNRYSNF